MTEFLFNIPRSRHQSSIGARLAFRDMTGEEWCWPDEWLWHLANTVELVRTNRCEVFLTLMQMTHEWGMNSAWKPKGQLAA